MLKIGDIVKSKRTGKLYIVVEENEGAKSYSCEPVKREDSKYLFYDSDVEIISKESESVELDIKLTLYFEIRDSKMFGGVGTIGYMNLGIDIVQLNYGKDNLFNKREIMERYISDQTKSVAEFAKVPVECVRVISKEEYDINTDDDEAALKELTEEDRNEQI